MPYLKNQSRVGLLVALACSFFACSYDAGYFNQRMKELDELAASAAPGMRAKIEQKKAVLLADFGKRPAEDQVAMDRLCRRARMAVKETRQLLEVVPSAGKLSNAEELAAYQKKFIGVWEGGNARLVISAAGKVEYSPKKGSASQVSGGITDFQKGQFKVGFMGISDTTFKIDRAPSQSGGEWKVKINGVVYSRVSAKSPKPR